MDDKRGPVTDPRYTNPPRPMMPNPFERNFEPRPLREKLAFWRRRKPPAAR